MLEAIDENDDDHMVEELGDVLLQIMLHAQIGEDEGYFTIDDVIEAITSKMIRRHPHVFGDKAAKRSMKFCRIGKTLSKTKKEEKKHDLPRLKRVAGTFTSL